jgi:hypothetical protein
MICCFLEHYLEAQQQVLCVKFPPKNIFEVAGIIEEKEGICVNIFSRYKSKCRILSWILTGHW